MIIPRLNIMAGEKASQEFLQDVYFDSSSFLYKDKKGNMNPSLVDVPVYSPDGTTDKLTFASLSGITIVSSLGTATPAISGNDILFTAGWCSRLVLSNGKVLNMQEYSGNTAFYTTGEVAATYVGTSARFSRVSSIQSPHQSADLKRVTHTGGVAYIPATVDDAIINAKFTGVTLIEILSGLYKDDGSLMNLHPTTNSTYIGGDNGYAVFSGNGKYINTGLNINGFNNFTFTWYIKSNWIGSDNRFFAFSSGGYFSALFDSSGAFYVNLYDSGLKTISTPFANDGEYHKIQVSYVNTSLYLIVDDIIKTTKTGYFNGFNTNSILYLGHVSSSTNFNCAGFEVEANNIVVRKYPLNGNSIDIITNTAAVINGATFEPTISSYINSIEAANPTIDLNTYEAGEPLPTEYKHAIVADKSTNSIKLKKP